MSLWLTAVLLSGCSASAGSHQGTDGAGSSPVSTGSTISSSETTDGPNNGIGANGGNASVKRDTPEDPDREPLENGSDVQAPTQADNPQLLPESNHTFSLSSVPAYAGNAYIAMNGNEPYFDTSNLSSVSYENYSELDALGRCGVAHACIGQDLMPTEERGDISQIKPTGWQSA